MDRAPCDADRALRSHTRFEFPPHPPHSQWVAENRLAASTVPRRVVRRQRGGLVLAGLLGPLTPRAFAPSRGRLLLALVLHAPRAERGAATVLAACLTLPLARPRRRSHIRRRVREPALRTVRALACLPPLPAGPRALRAASRLGRAPCFASRLPRASTGRAGRASRRPQVLHHTGVHQQLAHVVPATDVRWESDDRPPQSRACARPPLGLAAPTRGGEPGDAHPGTFRVCALWFPAAGLIRLWIWP